MNDSQTPVAAESAFEESRLIDLEVKVAHHELAIEELQEVLYSQQSAIEALEKTLKTLRERFDAVAGGDHSVGPGNEKPPHY